MVGGEDDDRVVGQPLLGERCEDRAEVVVDERDGAVVPTPCAEDIRLGDELAVEGEHRPEPPRRAVDRLGRLRVRRRVDLHFLVPVPVVARHLVGVVRVRERDDEQERP